MKSNQENEKLIAIFILQTFIIHFKYGKGEVKGEITFCYGAEDDKKPREKIVCAMREHDGYGSSMITLQDKKGLVYVDSKSINNVVKLLRSMGWNIKEDIYARPKTGQSFSIKPPS